MGWGCHHAISTCVYMYLSPKETFDLKKPYQQNVSVGIQCAHLHIRNLIQIEWQSLDQCSSHRRRTVYTQSKVIMEKVSTHLPILPGVCAHSNFSGIRTKFFGSSLFTVSATKVTYLTSNKQDMSMTCNDAHACTCTVPCGKYAVQYPSFTACGVTRSISAIKQGIFIDATDFLKLTEDIRSNKLERLVSYFSPSHAQKLLHPCQQGRGRSVSDIH